MGARLALVASTVGPPRRSPNRFLNRFQGDPIDSRIVQEVPIDSRIESMAPIDSRIDSKGVLNDSRQAGSPGSHRRDSSKESQ